jgi:hypothetical protein
MADKKISALTASSTPLAGTEVLPIVQSGATVKVAVSDLTVGRAVATGNLTTTGTATISSNAAIGTTSPNVNANRNTLTLQGAWGGEIDITVGATTHARFGTDNFSSGYSCRVESQDSIILKTGTSSNVVVETGNVVIGTSGKGIDFSATPGTGTSELFADYEEGTFTPAWTGSSGNPTVTYTTQTGQYTKIGNIVYFNLTLNSSAQSGGSGNLGISGLPFTSARQGTSYAVFVYNFVSSALAPKQASVSGTTFVCYTNNTDNVQTLVTALTGSGGSVYFTVGGFYYV